MILSLPKLNIDYAKNKHGLENVYRSEDKQGYIPDLEACQKLWDLYEVFPNIREHSLLVAKISSYMAQILAKKYPEKTQNLVETAYAAGLLHDIAKSYTIQHGGSHALLGASIVLEHTRNYHIANAVLNHVLWLDEDFGKIAQTSASLLVLYADKRSKHNKLVTIQERFEDLMLRYGTKEEYQANIHKNYIQTQKIEKALSEQLELDLNACTFDCGCVVA